MSALTTSNGTADTDTTAITIKIPGGSTITELKVMNKLGTGVVYSVRVDYPGIKTPQNYLMNQTSALEGTEVGSGKVLNMGVPVNIPVVGNVSSVDFIVRATVASQTFILGVKWTGP